MPDPKHAPKTMTLELTKQEAWSVIRALTAAIDNQPIDKEDKGPASWVHQRLLRVAIEHNNKIKDAHLRE